jgi:N-acetylglucosaminyl-diphospho-decaprenol L-rhamnosyltransferase
MKPLARFAGDGSHVSQDLNILVVIVTYNSEKYIARALHAVYASQDITMRVVVVDNASVDQTVVEARRIDPALNIIRSDINLGFSHGCNIGANDARDDELILFLNPDSEVDKDAIRRASDLLVNDPTIGVVGGRTRYETGVLNPTCCFTRPTIWSAVCHAAGLSSLVRDSRLFNPEYMGRWDRYDNREVDFITGCFLLIRASLYRKLGGFDERFFIYGEDADLGARVRAMGLRCVHAGRAGLIHIGGASDPIKSEKLTKVFAARRQYYDKHWSARSAFIGAKLLNVAVLSRIAGSTITQSAHRDTWRSIWKGRSAWLSTPSSGGELQDTMTDGRADQQFSISPQVRLKPRPFDTRARIAYRVLRHIRISISHRYLDFVGQGLATAVRLPLLAIDDLVGPRRRSCNVCGWSGPRFYPNTGPGYHDSEVTCPGCSSLDRHRSLLALLVQRTRIFESSRVIEVAPMRRFESLMRAQPSIDYTSFDIERYAMEWGDITAMKYPTESVDYFICFHVLEHIPDANAALAEIYRVLRPGGTAIFQVPIDWRAPHTVEYSAPDPRDVGHVRQYGRDFADHLERAGLQVTSVSVTDVLPYDILVQYGLSPEPIFFATKPIK